MKKEGFFQKDGTKKLLSSLISILIGLVVGVIGIVLVGVFSEDISGKGIWESVRLILFGIANTGRTEAGELAWGFNSVNLGNMLFRATPLIMTGLSVAVAYKTGLFNIGASGQYLMGTTATLIIALSVPTETVPPFVVWLLALLGGMLAGAIWGAIPGILKAFLNINEVLACIMTNWIAANLVTMIFDGSSFRNGEEYGKLGYIFKTTHNGVATPKLGLDRIFSGSQINGGIIVAILIAVLMYVIMYKTTLGYELTACGSNRHAARYAGIRDKRNIILSMAIAGALAAAGASLYYLSGNTEFGWQTYQSLPAEGFNGIPVALLALTNPIGVIFSGSFLAMLSIIGQQLTGLTAYNEYITDVIIAVIVYLSAFSLAIRMLLSRRKKKTAAAAVPVAAGAAPPSIENVGTEGTAAETPLPDAKAAETPAETPKELPAEAPEDAPEEISAETPEEAPEEAPADAPAETSAADPAKTVKGGDEA